ncbi:MAG: redoxin family protein [Acidobacteria bacterium]|nr:redoxin family protein [Acidobacteriota bacterium]
MRCVSRVGSVIVGLCIGISTAAAQTPTTIVKDVRTAIACTAWPCSPTPDLSDGEALLTQYRSAHGTTSEALEALSWLGRAALAGNQLDKASAYAADTYALAIAALKQRTLEDDAPLEIALGAAIEVQAQARTARGQRSDAVYFLRRELDTFRDTPLHRRIQKNLHLLSLDGQPAPALEDGDSLGRPMPRLEELRGKVVLLFFWAHWCPDCRAQAPILSTLVDRYRNDGLVVVAPTQRYGYTVRRTAASPEEELRYIGQIRDTFYSFLRDEPVPVSDVNHTRYGVSTTPTLVLVDRNGLVRLYHPGTMTEEELRAAIEPVLASRQ